jgi:long-chain acyl-CoA synthetase
LSNAAQAIWDRASSDADRVALRGASEPWTYGRLRERAAAVASRLREAQVAPGDRVLLVAPSVPEFAGAYFGILAAGAIAVTANTMSTRPELEHLGSDAEMAVVVGWSDGGSRRPVLAARGRACRLRGHVPRGAASER